MVPGVDLDGGEPFLVVEERLIKRITTAVSVRARGSCKDGSHLFGKSQYLGAGLLRLVCEDCGAVSIDIRDADYPLTRTSINGNGTKPST